MVDLSSSKLTTTKKLYFFGSFLFFLKFTTLFYLMEQDIDMMATSTATEGIKPFFTDGLWIGKTKANSLLTITCFCLHSNT